jgi:predicted transcriptional regulator
LRVGRANLDLSQHEVARLGRISRFRLHQAERGLIGLRTEELERVAGVLQIPQLTTYAPSE